jgi:integrase/recombinase XerD
MAWNLTKDKFLTITEVKSLYKSLADARDLAIQRNKNFSAIRDHFILSLLLETGLRVSELVALKVSDFRSRTLVVTRGKNGKSRNILLPRSTQRLIKNYLRLKRRILKEPTSPESFLVVSERIAPFSQRGIRKRVKLWFEMCGFSELLSCHSCRHTYVTHMIAAGVDLALVRDNAGHSNISTTSIYSHAVRQDLGDLNIYSSPFVGTRNNSRGDE